jgi:hypothetical protein
MSAVNVRCTMYAGSLARAPGARGDGMAGVTWLRDKREGSRVRQGGGVASRPRLGTGRNDVSGRWGRPARPANPSLQPLHFFDVSAHAPSPPSTRSRNKARPCPLLGSAHELSSTLAGPSGRVRRFSFGSAMADTCGWSIVKCLKRPDQLPRAGYSLLARSIPANAPAKQMPQNCGPRVRLYPP